MPQCSYTLAPNRLGFSGCGLSPSRIGGADVIGVGAVEKIAPGILYGYAESNDFADALVHHGLPDRDVGAIRLLRHAGAHHLLHGAAAGLRGRPGQPHLECSGGADLRGTGHRRLDRRQGPRHTSHHAAGRVHPGPGLRADDGAEREHLDAVRRAGRDRGRQRPVQGQRRQPRAQDLRGRRLPHRQRFHHLLHGGEHRLDHLDAAHAVDQGLRQRHLGPRTGLARGVRRLLHRLAGGPGQLFADACLHAAHRLGAGRKSRAQGQAAGGARRSAWSRWPVRQPCCSTNGWLGHS